MGQDLAILLDVDDGGTGRANGGAVLGSLSIGEGDIAKVGERSLLAVLQEVLHNPLGVLLAKRGLGTNKTEVVRHSLLLGQVLDSSSAGGQRVGDDRHGHQIAGSDGDALEIVGEVGEPLVPSRVAGLAVLSAEVDTCGRC